LAHRYSFDGNALNRATSRCPLTAADYFGRRLEPKRTVLHGCPFTLEKAGANGKLSCNFNTHKNFWAKNTFKT
jgi:hypothetical protein